MAAPRQNEIYDLIKARLGKTFPAGTQLPREVDWAAQLRVSRKTLRGALARLERERRIERLKGRGTFVRNQSEHAARILLIRHPESSASSPDAMVLSGVQTTAAEENVECLACMPASLLDGAPETAARRILELKIDGIIWYASCFNGSEPLLKVLHATGLPVVLPHAGAEDASITGFSVLFTEEAALIREALTLLASRGFRRTAILGDNATGFRNFSPAAICGELRKAGLDDDGILLQFGPNTPEWTREAVRMIFSSERGAQALFCSTDFMAPPVYATLRELKLKVPDDVAVLSIGGQLGGEFLSPPLSTCDFGNLEIGRTALHLLMEHIRERRAGHPFVPRRVITPYRLIERESTQPHLSIKPTRNNP